MSSKYEKASFVLDIFYSMDFIRKKVINKYETPSISDYIENIKHCNSAIMQTNVVTLSRSFFLVNPLNIKSAYYKNRDNIILKCEVNNNIVWADEDCTGQKYAKSIFKEKPKAIDQKRENIYKIYIEDVNPIIENTIIHNSEKNLNGDIVNHLEIISLQDLNDIELECGESCFFFFKINTISIKSNQKTEKKIIVCHACQFCPKDTYMTHNKLQIHAPRATLPAQSQPNSSMLKNGMTNKPARSTVMIQTPRTSILMGGTIPETQSQYINTTYTECDDPILHNFRQQEQNTCKCLIANSDNAQTFFDTPMVLNVLFKDETMCSLYYPISWSLDASEPINLT